MNMVISCPSCAKSVSADTDGRVPPWCRHCGANLKTATDTPALTASTSPHAGAPAAIGGETRAVTAPSRGVLFIQGCDPSLWGTDHALHRIYITSTDLLVFRIGYGAVSGGQVLPRTKPRRVFAGGLVGAVAIMVEAKRARLASRVQELDEADEATLRHYAAEWEGSFSAGADDLAWLRIDPPSRWVRFYSGIQHEGVLKFAHRDGAKMVLVLPGVKDVRRAAQELPRLFSGCVEINLPWASAAALSGRQA
jgi:hypothetical protein